MTCRRSDSREAKERKHYEPPLTSAQNYARDSLIVVERVFAQPLGAARVQRVETWPERDLAILLCNVSDVTQLTTWLTNRVQALTDLSSFSYLTP